MKISMQDTTTSHVAKRLTRLREKGGVVALGRVLTLVISTDDAGIESALEAANAASLEHPCRIIVLALGDPAAPTRLDAEIRVGGDAGASDVVILWCTGDNAQADESLVGALLLPDAPIVAWWPGLPPAVPSATPLGRLAHRRITDSGASAHAESALWGLRAGHRDGDTDLAWTRLTLWRIQVAGILDNLDARSLTSVSVDGAPDSPSTLLLASWLTLGLRIPVTIAHSKVGRGIRSVRLRRPEGDVVLSRSQSQVARLYQQGRPVQRIALPRRSDQDCLAEELRRLDPDEVFGAVLHEGLPLADLSAVQASER
ncbi:glucose-6-phosphate dehydrogenase assembly protein OpcA [Micrococcus sp. EYE_162]|uniref:glucose-6-phosphate dehydrogenase assembly protein OpcA n=1 Tax=unclassified Micrococcus TaxID=2620948 RepID=UPI002006152E|nr:glucose-6-phosphate dehydrogenase assembly protein OpcA [Micrococcus sp. EYE_212]MCK6171770.1 glucose-6-phosphate dehydrogenase assembly protein OpcA [Micrococcus sp. EYE_162]